MDTIILRNEIDPAVPAVLADYGGIVVPQNGGTYTVVPDDFAEAEFWNIYPSSGLRTLVEAGDIVVNINGDDIAGAEVVDWANPASSAELGTTHDLVTVTDTDTIDFTLSTQALTADVKKQMSLDSDGSGLKLSGDAASPGNLYYYGTNAAGTKGFHILNQNFQDGTVINGKIVPSVASNNLTVALKTAAGGDPSASSPVHVWIGGTKYTVTSALSVTRNAGTNWCNAGNSLLATYTIYMFVYLGYNATDGVTIGFSRIPYGIKYSDFSATTTKDIYCAISTITNAAATDRYVNIGRFAAELSAAAGHTWSIPASNLTINAPTFFTPWMNYLPSLTVQADISSYAKCSYMLHDNMCKTNFYTDLVNVTSSGNQIRINLPLPGQSAVESVSYFAKPSTAWAATTILLYPVPGYFDIYKTAALGTWLGTETNVQFQVSTHYEV